MGPKRADSESRVKAVRDLQRITLDELTEYAIKRSGDDSFRKDLVEREIQRRMVDATWKGGVYGGIAGALTGAFMGLLTGTIGRHVLDFLRNHLG
jgi:hypothetical protein